MFVLRLSLLSLFLLSFIPFVSACNFEDIDCERIGSSFNSISAVFSDSSVVGDYEITLSDKDNRANRILLEKRQADYVQQNPFVESGVYVVEVVAKDKAGNLLNGGAPFEFEYVFDNLQPLPPIVDPLLSTVGSSLSVAGTLAHSSYSVVIKVNANAEFEIGADEQAQFTTTLSLTPGVNIVEFRTKNLLGETSEPLRRVVYSGAEFDGTFGVQAVPGSFSPNLDQKNPRTIALGSGYLTSSRMFYVEGSAQGSNLDYVKVNGRQTPVVAGKYGAFVLLNQGENTIEVAGAGQSRDLEVEFEKVNFDFLEVHMPKVVSSGVEPTITGETSVAVPFEAYLNGEFFATLTPASSGAFTIALPALQRDTLVSLKGYDGEIYSEIIRVNGNGIEIEALSHDKLAEGTEFFTLFIGGNDVGIDDEALTIVLNGEQISSYQREGDIYMVPIDHLGAGSHSLIVVAEDHTVAAGEPINPDNSQQESFSFQILSDSTATIKEIELSQGSAYGDVIFVSPGQVDLTIIPTGALAFEHMYFGGADVVSYSTSEDLSTEVSLEVPEGETELELIYIDKNFVETTRVLDFIAINEGPKLTLDYVPHATSSGQAIRVTGRFIEDDLMNMETLMFNGESYTRYGSAFEAYIQDPTQLVITGRDYAGNALDAGAYQFLLGVDTREPYLRDQDVNAVSESFTGFLENADSGDITTVVGYDGFVGRNTYLGSANIELPLQQKEGIRSLQLQGESHSGVSFALLDTFTSDFTAPQVYLTVEGSTYYLLVDERNSEVDVEELMVDGVAVSSFSNCEYELSTHGGCYTLGALDSTALVTFSLVDAAGHTFSGQVAASQAAPLANVYNPTDDVRAYFEGVDIVAVQSRHIVQGNIDAGAKVTEVSIADGTCEFNQISFVCETTLLPGLNELEVYVQTTHGNTSEWINTTLPKQFLVEVDSVTGERLYQVGERYYYREGQISLIGSVLELNRSVERDAVMTLLVDGREIPSGTSSSGAFTINIDLGQDVSGHDSRELELQVQGEDEQGNIALSEKIVILYNRALDAIISVIVG